MHVGVTVLKLELILTLCGQRTAEGCLVMMVEAPVHFLRCSGRYL